MKEWDNYPPLPEGLKELIINFQGKEFNVLPVGNYFSEYHIRQAQKRMARECLRFLLNVGADFELAQVFEERFGPFDE